MQKGFVSFCYSIALLLLVGACGNTGADTSDLTKSAEELGKKFIKELYNVDDINFDYDSMDVESLINTQNDFSSYLTEKEWKELANKRFFLMPLEAASNQNSTITVQQIEFENTNHEQEENALNLDHSFTLLFQDSEGNEVEEVKINGQMTVIYTDNDVKIDRYYDSEIPNELLYP